MTKKFKYRPPLKYLFVGLGGVVCAVIFGKVISLDEIWFSLIMAIFCLVFLAVGIAFLVLFFLKFSVTKLKMGNEFIEIPGRWRDKKRVNFNDILEIGEIDTYDHVIEIKSKHGYHLIERNWMRKREFDYVKSKLQEYWINRSHQGQDT